MMPSVFRARWNMEKAFMLRSIFSIGGDVIPYVVSLLTIACVVTCYFLSLRHKRLALGICIATLSLTGLVAFANYFKAPLLTGRHLNTYEFYHYFMGAKYCNEVGYYNLYNATIVADTELEGHFHYKNETIRNLYNRKQIKVSSVLSKTKRYKKPFLHERWDEFVGDVGFFRNARGAWSWNRILNDHGFNGSPSWTMIANPLANAASTSNRSSLTALSFIDNVFLLLMLGMVTWAYGVRSSLLLLVLLGVHCFMKDSHLKAAFIRLDWIVGLIITICLIRKECYVFAGFIFSWVVLSRVFPAVFALGMFIKMAFQFTRYRKLETHYLKFFLAAAVGVLLLVGISVAFYGRWDIWLDYFHKISLHNDYVSPGRLGFKNLFVLAFREPMPGENYQDFFLSHPWLWWGVQALIIGIVSLAALGLEDDDATALGFVLVFFMLATTYYYYILLLVPMLMFSKDAKSPWRVIGVCVMFVMNVGLYSLLPPDGKYIFSFSFLANAMLLALVVYTTAATLITASRNEERPTQWLTGKFRALAMKRES